MIKIVHIILSKLHVMRYFLSITFYGKYYENNDTKLSQYLLNRFAFAYNII